MAAPQNFRSALNGFHREDVVRYIEYLNARHDAQINQLTAELELLRQHTSPPAQDPALQEQLDQAQLDQQEPVREDTGLQEECNRLRGELSQSQTRIASLEAELEAARAASAVPSVNLELEAYRRAERTERVARERAEQIYHQANGALADATVKVDEAYSQLGSMADQVSQQLAQLQQAVVSSRDALAGASSSLYTLRPGTEES